MNNTIYVTGHRHPDSDSICSAITYADLLRRCGQEAVACRQGPLNEETKFILKRFHQENPLLLTDARTMISDIDIDPPLIIPKTETVHHAWHEMLRTQNRSLFVVDENGKLCGICTTSNLSHVRLVPDGDLDALMSTATVTNIAKTIGGKILVNPENFHFSGMIRITTGDDVENSRFEIKDSIVLLTTGEEKQKRLIHMGIAGMVITSGIKASDDVARLAKEKGCALIECDHDTMHTSRIISEA